MKGTRKKYFYITASCLLAYPLIYLSLRATHVLVHQDYICFDHPAAPQINPADYPEVDSIEITTFAHEIGNDSGHTQPHPLIHSLELLFYPLGRIELASRSLHTHTEVYG